MEFDIDLALEHDQVAKQDVLHWEPDHPFSSCIHSGKACEGKIPVIVEIGAEHLFSDWPDFQCTMVQSSSYDESGTNCVSVFNISDQCGGDPPKEEAPNSPHSVLEQHLTPPPPSTGSKSNLSVEGKENEAETESGFIPESLDFSRMDCEFQFASMNPVAAGEYQFIRCRLFHLLLAGAEAMFSQTLDLAQVILLRLKELTTCSSTTSPIFQRITLYFTEGLQSLLDGARIAKILNPDTTSYLDTVTAFQALHEGSPYIKFGHYIANQAILEAIGDDKRVHIIDYDIAEGIQWPSLMQALALREGGSPHLRITAVYHPHVKHQLSIFHATKASLIECAAAFKIPLSYHQAKIDEEAALIVGLRLIKGETLIVNCMLHLLHMPHRSPSSVLCFLKAVNKISPRILTFVEEEVMRFSTQNSVEKCFQALHHYCAMLDSLEATLCETTTHMLVERAFLATRIKTALIALSHSQGEEWSTLLQSAGFKQVEISTTNACQAKLLLGLFKDGYRLEEDHANKRMLLSWKFRPLMSASIWS